MKSKLKETLFKFNTVRRVVQVLSFVFFSAVIFNLGELPILLPVLWTWGGPQNTVGDAFTALQFMLYDVVFPWLVMASFLIIGILLGKSLCGWVCPFGFIQDMIGFIKRKHTEFSVRTHESMIYVKYAVAGIALLVSITFSAAKLVSTHQSYESALGVFAKAPFTALSPAETLFAALPRMVLDIGYAVTQTPFPDVASEISAAPPLLWIQLSIMVGVLVFAAYVPRGWCKYFCPYGAIMAILNRFSFLGLRRDLVKCTKDECRQCVEACPMRVHILDLSWEKFSDPECIYCLKCVDVCPYRAIRLKYP